MAVDPNVKAKIAKLLRLAQSSNEHEAALAMEKATDLAIQHDLDLDDLNGPERKYQKRTIEGLKVDMRYYMTGYVHALGHAISMIAPVKFHLVVPTYKKTRIVVKDGKKELVAETKIAREGYAKIVVAAMGEAQLELGEQLLRYILAQVERLRKQEKLSPFLTAMEKWRIQKGFRLGASQRLFERCWQIKQNREGKVMTGGTGRSLVVGAQHAQDLKDIAAAQGDMMTDNREVKLTQLEHAGMRRGREAADKIGLNEQLGTSQVPEARRLG